MTGRAVGVLVAVVVVCALIGLYIALYLTVAPPSVAATRTPAGAQLYLASVPTAEASDPHPTWVSFYSVSPTSTNWVHSTTYEVPANTWVHVTIYQFDTATGLRNEFIAQVRGTPTGSFLLNGKPTVAVNPTLPAHAWAIPALNVSVPLPGISATAKNPCAQAPCSLSNDHETIQFTFHSPSRKGLYRWQCFVPCGAGFIQGNGGPMQTVGYMGGYLKVV